MDDSGQYIDDYRKKLEDSNFKFSLEQLFAMYTNVSYLGLLKDVAKKDSIEVARALLKKIGTEKNANLAITKFGCDFQRRAFFESFRDIDYSNAMQVVINYNKNSFVPPISFSLIKGKPQILDVAKCDQLSSSLDQVQINKELIEYSSGQKDVYHELSEAKHAKESCATIIARNSLCNYTPFFAFLLQKDSEKFFEMAEKTDLLWNMVQNQNQTYLDFIEDCLSSNSEKTLQLLLKRIIDVDENRCKSALCSCIENTGVDYSELLMAIYQLQPEPEKIFSLPVETKDGHIVNLLTYYVLQKDYKAEEFISYLTNSNILFIRKLLPLDVLHGMKDRKYKLAKDNADHTEASLRSAIADVEGRLGIEIGKKEADLTRLVLETFIETQKRIDNLEDNMACMAADLQDLYFQHRSGDGYFCAGSRQLRPIGW